MDLAKLALSLGLPKESTEAAVFEALSKRDAESRKAVDSLASLKGQLPEMGLKLDTAGKLVRVEPLKLDILDTDDEEKKALKTALAAAAKKDQMAALNGRKDFITKLAKDLSLPPALMPLATEVLSVREELETVMLSKDGTGIELGKCAKFPEKLETLLKGIVALKGKPMAAPTAQTDEQLSKQERDKVYADFLAKHADGGSEKKQEETAAAK